jgi:hypothetical protein
MHLSFSLEPILNVVTVLVASRFVSLVRRSCDAIGLILRPLLLLLAGCGRWRFLSRRFISRAFGHCILLREVAPMHDRFRRVRERELPWILPSTICDFGN